MNGVEGAVIHGGDLDAIGRRYGIDSGELLDFSANLNPLGPPPSLLRELAEAATDVAELGRYPDPESRQLRTALGQRLDVEPDAIVIANGAAALFGIALHALEVERCVVPMPAFSEHRHALATAGAIHSGVPLDPTREFALQPERIVAAIRASDADACLVTNPHNPSGALTPRESMLQLAHDAKSLGTVTIVDEAFIDYAPEASVTRDAAARDALVTIRSLTKFFAVPALRVGYAVCDPSLARIMRRAIPSWPVTTLASRAVAIALDDAEFTSRTLVANERERARLAARLAAIGLRANPSATNFLLISLPEDAPRAPELTQRLVLQSRIVVRDCSSFEGLEAGDYIRVAVRAAAENERLVDALARALGRC